MVCVQIPFSRYLEISKLECVMASVWKKDVYENILECEYIKKKLLKLGNVVLGKCI